MSWVSINGETMTFSEYLISESVKPKFTEFGTDLKNEKWKKLNDNFFVTCFKIHKTLYMAVYRLGYIGFYVAREPEEFNNLKNITNYDDFVEDYHFDRTSTHGAIIVFNNFFYVINKAILGFKPHVIRFDGNDKDLGGLYETMVKNRFFTKQVNELGYTYSGRKQIGKNNFFEFERVK